MSTASGRAAAGVTLGCRTSYLAAAAATLALLVPAAPAAGAVDLCADTPKKATVVLDGCASVDIVRQPETFAAPADDGLLTALGSFPGIQASARKTLERARKTVAGAAGLMGRGSVCPSGRAYDKGLKSLRDAHRRLLRELPRERKRIQRGFPPPVGDVSEGQHVAISLGFGPAALAGAIAELNRVAPAFRGPCAHVDGKLNFNGTTGHVDDGERLVRGGRRSLVLSSGLRDTILGGGTGRLRGIAFDDGTGVITSADVGAGRRGGKPVKVKVPTDVTANCILPRIVPFARAGGNGEPRHPFEGYESGGVLRLERGMEIAADQLCPSNTTKQRRGPTPWVTTSYALRLELTYAHELFGGSETATLASELDDADSPVPLPPDMSRTADAKLVVTDIVKTCTGNKVLDYNTTNGKITWGDGFTCASKELGTPARVHMIRVLEKGSYASAVYSKTTFNLDTRPKGACELVTVTPMIDEPSVSGAQGLAFEAEAWSGVGNNPCSSTRPQMTTIGSGEAFAVYLDDPVPVGLTPAGRHAQFGVHELSGLTWPRVVGTLNGQPFAYSAKTPPLVRDRLNICPPGTDTFGANVPDTFHRAPFDPGNTSWMVAQGNEDDPAHYMADGITPIAFPEGSSEPYHGSKQRYGFDVINDSDFDNVTELGHPIRASRAGRVVLLDRDEKGNAMTGLDEVLRPDGLRWPSTTGITPKPDKTVSGYDEVGNYVWIQHDDGRYTTYNHLRYKTVPAALKVGDWVRRGEVIARTGNTGNSSGPHLHWGGFRATAIPEGNPTVYVAKLPVRLQDTNHLNGCWVPREGEFFNSNNDLIDVPPFF